MLEINKHPLECFYTVTRFPHHESIKSILLDEIQKQECESLISIDSYYTDTVNKLDWNRCFDDTRGWTKELKPLLQPILDSVAFGVGYKNAVMAELWFQQYVNGNTHGWHVHGSNFTGVYYLELPEAAPKTELIVPIDQKEVITPNVVEGDILIFPV
jgi:hypothetical protein